MANSYSKESALARNGIDYRAGNEYVSNVELVVYVCLGCAGIMRGASMVNKMAIENSVNLSSVKCCPDADMVFF